MVIKVPLVFLVKRGMLVLKAKQVLRGRKERKVTRVCQAPRGYSECQEEMALTANPERMVSPDWLEKMGRMGSKDPGESPVYRAIKVPQVCQARQVPLAHKERRGMQGPKENKAFQAQWGYLVCLDQLGNRVHRDLKAILA
jgi:hypothetical protein